MRLTDKHKTIIELYKNGGSLKQDENGYYYIVPTSVRRSGKMYVSVTTFNKLKDKGLINDKTLNNE